MRSFLLSELKDWKTQILHGFQDCTNFKLKLRLCWWSGWVVWWALSCVEGGAVWSQSLPGLVKKAAVQSIAADRAQLWACER